MSEDRDLDPIVAAGLGANKGFWIVQLRDRLGQWMKMGQKALMMARLSFGLPAFPVRPTYVGPSQRTKGLGRFLVKGKTRAEDRVYELDPAKLESIQAEIPEADLIRQGITPGPRVDSAGNPIASREFSEDEIIDLSQAFSEPATEEDYRLAKATPTAEEQKLIDEEKAKSPLAKLAPGTEAKMSEQEVSDLLDGKTTPSAVKTDEEAPKAGPEDLGFEETTSILDRDRNQRVWEKEYKDGQIKLEVNKNSRGQYQAVLYGSRPTSEDDRWGTEEVLDVSEDESAFEEADKEVSNDIKNGGKDYIAVGDAFANDKLRSEEVMAEAIKDAMDGKLVDIEKIIKLNAGTPVGKGAEFFEDDDDESGKKGGKTPEGGQGEPSGGLVPKKQDSISLEELDALAKPEEFEKFFGFVPSQEQTRIIAAIALAKKNTAVRAGAGAGKTTTYVALAKALMELDPTARVALLQLNRTNADEAAKLVPRNTTSNTVDAYFGRPHIVAMVQAKTGVLKGTTNEPHVGRYMSTSNFHKSGAVDLANHFLMDEMSIGGENYTAAKVGALVKRAVDRFAQGTDTKIGPQHFSIKTKAKKGEKSEDVEISDENLKKLVSYARAYWEDLNHVPTWDERVDYKKKDGTTGKKFVKGVTAISPTHAFKMWALSNPDLSKLKSEDGKPVTHIFLDEAQDTNAVFEKVLNDNLARGTAPLIAMVGDRAQSIYEFRGSRDALTTFAKNVAGADLTLTTTRRFGENLLPNANGFLNLLGEEYRLKSEVDGGEILDNDDISQIPDAKGNTAVQTRTNAGVFEQIEKYDQMGYTVGVTEKMYDDLTNATTHLEWLSQDFASRPKNPPATSQDFTGMRSIADLIRDAEVDPQSRAGFWWRLVQEDPEGKIKKLKELAEKVIVEREQLDIATVTNLKAADGESGAFNGIAWKVEGDSIILSDEVKNAMFSALPGREDKNFRQAVIGQKEDKFKKKPAIVPELKLSDGSTPEWKTRKVGEQWVTSLIVPDEAVREDYLNKIASLFMEATKEPVIPDILVSTAHRFKGLEKDNIFIGPDFPNPEVVDGKLIMPSRDEFQLGYTAVTRPRKRIFYGSLAYGLDYTGENGMRKANEDLGRDSNLGLDVIKREADAQAKLNEKRKPGGGTALKSGKGQNFAGGFQFFEDEEDGGVIGGDETPGVLSTSPNTPGKDLVADWYPLRNGTYTKRINGTTWNIRENKDGTIVARPRTNEDKLGSFKFNSWEQLKNNFPDLEEKGKKANRDVLKDKVKPLDPNGDIAKAIDAGADPRDIADMISNSGDFFDAVENGDVNFVSIFAAVDNIGSSDVRRPNPRASKPKNPAPKKATKTVPVAAADVFTKYPNNQMKPTDQFNILDDSIMPFEKMLKEPGMGNIKSMIDKLVKFGGKVNPDGSVTIYRKESVDTVGPKKDTPVSLEIRVSGSKSSDAVISYVVTDRDTGESTQYWDMATADSLKAVLNRAKRRLDTYWLRDPETLGELNPNTYGGTFGAINMMRKGFTQASARKGAGGIARLLADKSATDSNILIRTPMEHMQIALNGREKRLNTSIQNYHTQQRKEIKSVFEAIETGNVADAAYTLRQYLNHIPNTPEAMQQVRDFLSTNIKRILPDISPNKLNGMLEDMFDTLDSTEVMPTGSIIKPHMARNGVLLEQGQIVRWTNNVGDEVVGKVTYLVPYDNPDGGQYTYGDFAEVEFKGGKVERLNSNNMSVVDSKTPLTPYAPWVREDDKKIEEAGKKGFTVDFVTGEIKDKQSVIDVLESFKGYADVSTDNEKKDVKDVKVGDVLYDDDGNALGKVATIKKGKQKGVSGYLFSFRVRDNKPDMFFATDDQTNVPKPPKRAATTTSNLDIAKAAAELNLAPSADGTTSAKKIQTHQTKIDPDTNTDIKGTNRKAVKPTDEANAILDKQLELGEQAWNMTEPRIVDELNDRGYKIKPGTKYEDLDAAVKAEYDKSLKALDKAKQDVNTFVGGIKNDITPSVELAILDKMEADNLYDPVDGIDFKKLAKELRDAGLENYSYDVRSLTGADPSDQLTGVAAYQMISDPRNKSKASRLFKALDDKQAEHVKAKNNRSEFSRNLGDAERDATKKTLEDLGVSFDDVSLNEFENRIISVQDNKPLDALSTFKSARALRTAFDYMPSNRIRQLSKYLKDNNVNLQILSGVERGHFKQLPNGDLEITLSTSAGTSANDSTALHELQHFLDEVDGNGNVTAHAWLHRRATGPDGKLRPLFGWGRGEIGFSVDDLSSPYTTRRYERGDIVLDPNFKANEVNSTIMEDLFLDAGSVSRPTGQMAIVKKTRQRVNRKTKVPMVDAAGNPLMEDYIDLVRNPYHDKATDKWYADESMTEELNIREWYGRKRSEGLDRNVKHYGMGMLLMMNDWSATTGLGE